MTARNAHLAVYQRMTRLYPSSFRHNYDADLVALFAKQIEDELPARVWARTLRDLVISVPTQRLETHMNRPSSHLLTALSGVGAATAALLAFTLGTGPAMPVFLVVAFIGGAIAVWSWQAGQPVRADKVAGKSWWKVLLAGPALAALTFVAMAIPWPEGMDLGDNAYWLIVIAFMTSLTLAATGLVLGIVAVVEGRRTRQLGTSPT
jgi:hypothetical protein